MAQLVVGAAGSACPINSAGAVVKCRNECRETGNGLFRSRLSTPSTSTVESEQRNQLQRSIVQVIIQCM